MEKEHELSIPKVHPTCPEEDFSIASEDDISVHVQKPPQAFSDTILDETKDDKLGKEMQTFEERFPEKQHIHAFHVDGFESDAKVKRTFSIRE